MKSKMLGGILSRCVGQEESRRKLKEVYDKIYRFFSEISLHRKLQGEGFYQPNMGKDADLVQTQCEACYLAVDREETYAVFTSEDWRSPFMQYLAEGVLSQKHSERYMLRKLAACYFLHEDILFKNGYDGNPLRYLGPEEAKEMIKEVHAEECKEHQGKKKLYRCMLQMGCYWPTIQKDKRICEEMSQLPSAGQPNSHPPTKFTQHGHPMALPYLGA